MKRLWMACAAVAATALYLAAQAPLPSPIYGGGSGGGTIASTSNILQGDGAGNATSSGIAAANVPLLGSTNVFTANNKIQFNGASDYISFGGTTNGVITGQTNAGGTKYQVLTDNSGSGGPAEFRFSSDSWFRFNSTSNLAGGSLDTGISRSAAGTVAIGTGAQGAVDGTLSTTGLTIAGSAVTFSGLGSATGTPDSVCLNTNTLKRNAALTCTVSSRDYKTGIDDLHVDDAAAMLLALQPVEFSYKDHTDRQRWGFIAEDVAAVDHHLADGYDDQGVARSLDQNGILALAIRVIQQQQRDIADLKAAVTK